MIGLPGLWAYSTRRHNIELPQNVSHARQALAIHELRRWMPLSLWNGVHFRRQQSLQQVWFPGAHSDVGGGYYGRHVNVRRLSDAPLEWIGLEAESWGLELRPEWRTELTRENGRVELHDESPRGAPYLRRVRSTTPVLGELLPRRHAKHNP